MPATVLISGIFITLALIFYPIGLWSGKMKASNTFSSVVTGLALRVGRSTM